MTGSLEATVTQAESTPVTADDDVYHYNDAGQITAADGGGGGGAPEDQCYASTTPTADQRLVQDVPGHHQGRSRRY